MKYVIVLLLSVWILPLAMSQNTIDLSGEWQVQLDENRQGINKDGVWHQIVLPASLGQAQIGDNTSGSDYGILTQAYKYIGLAWYQREIIIPKHFKNKDIMLYLERVLWESRLFIDGKEIDAQDALGTAHIHKIGSLKPGKHIFSIAVDNEVIHNIGDKGHAYGEYTQSIWNGIVGRMELQARDLTHIMAVRTFSDIDNDRLKIELEIKVDRDAKVQMSFDIKDLEDKVIIENFTIEERLSEGVNYRTTTIDLDGRLKKWSEFNPAVYVLNTQIVTNKSSDKIETEFGFLKISKNKHQVLINDKPIFLRGNLDCIHFPLTGYPSTSIEEWTRIFKIYKSYGLNHVRFHSWCPPEAAFKAANREGIYMQAEASIWIDWWMSQDMIKEGRPEMDTKGHPKGLGKDPERDQFVIEEMNRVVDFYGNNPSFTMFCIGNELGNSDFDTMAMWVGDLKAKDPRRLYSVSTARVITDVDDYMATHYIDKIGGTRGLRGAGTDWDFEEVYGQMAIPIIAHEIGQWPVYPSWDEIKKYTGTLKARNFEGFKAVATKNGILEQDEDFKMASGALNQLMYKYETESFLRTRSCAGVQLLSMQDYQGQGEALIGWLDAFWDSKGIISPEKFREHFDETVPLLRFGKFVWTNDEVFKANIQLSHYGESMIESAHLIMTIKTTDGQLLKQETYDLKDIKRGSLNDIASFSFSLSEIEYAQMLDIEISLEGMRFKNEWQIWVFPKELPEISKNNGIIVSKNLDKATMEALKKGEKVLLIANDLGTEETSVKIDFYPLYWSLTFFPGQGKTSIGMLFQDQHPVFNHFPTSFHSNWQWEPFRKKTTGFILNDLPKHYKPLAQVVDDFHRNNKEGVIFEFKVGKGSLLVCGYDLNDESHPASKQLKYSLLRYINSDEFMPKQQVDTNYLLNMFPEIHIAKNYQRSTEFENVILQVDAAKKLKESNKNVKSIAENDLVIISEENTNYLIKASSWKDEKVTAWVGKQMRLELSCPKGILGTLYVKFNDYNNQGREGFLTFEGRKLSLKDHHSDKGEWIAFHVMREDSNDGKLILETKATMGGNLMISDIVLTKD
ncbi:MAG: glycoside hydrolase family 2 [Bacteroidales bacterium]|nr:glycoside hydrolase family 2 [Bacteroidales bacterium]